MQKLSFKEVYCKSLLHEMDGTGEYTANLYRGCSHGCAYCYAPSLIHDDRRWGEFVDVKVNAPEILGRELRKAKKGVVFLSSASDPYQPAEARYKLTRKALELLLQRDFPVVILTRSPLVLRDIDLIKRLSWSRVGFSISSVPGRLYEPGVAPIERRLETLRALGAAGIKTWVSMAPLIPGMMGFDVGEMLAKFRGVGVSAVSAGVLRFQGYQASKEMFERATGVPTSELIAGGGELIRRVQSMIVESGFESRDTFFEWTLDSGIEQYFPGAVRAALP